MICSQCGGEFISLRITARTCSNTCRQKAKRKRESVTRHTQAPSHAGRFVKVCAYCGAEYKSNSPRSRFCSQAHKQASYRERKRRKSESSIS